jgi:predicted nucleic acid-binding protein
VIYLDSSVALAQLFAEDRSAATTLAQAPLISSRLLEYEVWNRIHARGFTQSHRDEAQALIDRVTLMDLTPSVLARALAPLPVPVRTLDALHLATAIYLCERGDVIELASFDRRLLAAARALDVPIYQM